MASVLKLPGPVVGFGARVAHAPRQNRREEVHERSGDRALVRTRARHDQLLEQRLVPDAHPLLHVGDLRLRLRAALRRVHQRKIAPVTVSMIAVEISSSMSEYPASPGDARIGWAS